MKMFRLITAAMLALAFHISAFVAPASAQQALTSPIVLGKLRSGVAPNGGKPPALSTCGTGPTIAAGSSNIAGRLVTGSGATTCTITFDTNGLPSPAFTKAPVCVVSAEVATQPTWTVSSTAITFATSIASTAYHYTCIALGS